MADVSYVKAVDEIKVPISDAPPVVVKRMSSSASIGNAPSSSLRRSSTGLASSNLKNKFKVVVLGDVMVGKTSFIARYLYGNFNAQYQATIGIDFLSTSVSLPDRTLRLQIWDTAGQERFRSLIPSYIRDCAIAFVLYDISERTSFNSVKEWVSRIRTEGGDHVIIVLCGNKSDIAETNRAVTTEEGENMAKEMGALFFETSAKTGDNVKSSFNRAAAELPKDEPVISETGTTPAAATSVVVLKGTTTPLEKDAQGLCMC
jgi:Ras-related protein Rab-6A